MIESAILHQNVLVDSVNDVDRASASRPTTDAEAHLRFDAAERSFVYAIGRRFAHDEDAADDIAQEAMLLAYRYRDSFRGASHPRTWLYRIATTTALSYLRRQRRVEARVEARDPLDMADLPGPSTAPSPEDNVARRELGDVLARGLADLEPKYASVLRLQAQDLRDSEIASQLGLSVANVKIRAHRARARMRATLAPELVAA
jgi:RNA polymerase sigma-70 factor (ECF subfamily)